MEVVVLLVDIAMICCNRKKDDGEKNRSRDEKEALEKEQQLQNFDRNVYKGVI